MRHWLVTDENHTHLLVLAETSEEALKIGTDGLDEGEKQDFKVKRIARVAKFDLDNEPTFYDGLSRD